MRRPVIAVTGSYGKTTTKEMIAAILKRRWRVFKSPQNKNAPSATRRYAKLLHPLFKAVVVEYGMDRTGYIKQHCRYIKPNIGVITNIGKAHIGNFGGQIRGIARAKSELIHYMETKGTLLLNADDLHSRLLQTKGFKGKIVRIGIHKKAEYQAYKIRYSNRGMTFRARLGGTAYRFYIPIPGKHNIYNALFAIAVTHRLGFTPQQMQQGLQNFERQKSRLYVYNLGNDRKIIDDSYNANPDAAKAALDVLSGIGKKRKIAVLGSMMELGSYTMKGHKEVGQYAALKNINRLYTFGLSAAHIARGAKERGFPARNIRQFISRHKLHKALVKEIKPGSTILVKGSNLVKMNITVKYLRQYFRNKRQDSVK